MGAGASMSEILKLLIEHLSFLYAPDRYRFIDSRTTTSFGGDAFLVLESDAMRVRFVRERSQLFMDFQRLEKRGRLDWFALDVVRRLITGERPGTAELTRDQIEFVKEHFGEIEDRFRGSRGVETEAELKKLERLRAKEQFG
jgi:hypothetical protein